MAGALYRVDYVGAQSPGVAVVYIGDDGITGMDAQGGIFSGGITVTDRARGTVVIKYANGATLVSGQMVPVNGQVVIRIDGRPDYLDGTPVTLDMGGQPVGVVFTKIKDIPIPPSMDFSNPANSGLLPVL